MIWFFENIGYVSLALLIWFIYSAATVKTWKDGARYFEEKNYSKALKIFKPLAEKDDKYAQYFLGHMYAEGKGVEKDCKKAVELYQKSANQGVAMAKNNLGVMYFNGDCVERDYKKSFDLTNRAAHLGIHNAQHSLGYMYQHGKGVEKNMTKACEWYKKAGKNPPECQN